VFNQQSLIVYIPLTKSFLSFFKTIYTVNIPQWWRWKQKKITWSVEELNEIIPSPPPGLFLINKPGNIHHSLKKNNKEIKKISLKFNPVYYLLLS